MTLDEPNPFQQLHDKLEAFADDMKAAGVHVGMGTPAKCVNCGQTWPCEGSKADA